MRSCLFVAIVIFASASPAQAYQGRELGRDCRARDDVSQARCEGFINGFLAGAQVDVGGEPINMWRFNSYSWCGPMSSDIAPVIESLFEAAGTGAATPHFPAPVMLAQALSAKFPCDGQATPGYQRLGPGMNSDQ